MLRAVLALRPREPKIQNPAQQPPTQAQASQAGAAEEALVLERFYAGPQKGKAGWSPDGQCTAEQEQDLRVFVPTPMPEAHALLEITALQKGCAMRTFDIVAVFLIGQDRGAQEQKWVYVRPPPDQHEPNVIIQRFDLIMVVVAIGYASTNSMKWSNDLLI